MPILTKLTLDLPASESARQLLLAQVGEIRAQACLALAEDQAISAAAVHDLRVALRRNLAILESYAGWLDPEWVRKTRKSCRMLLKPLGALRDLDVLAEQAAVLLPGPPVASGLPELLDLERRKLRFRLPDLLDGRDFQKWLIRQSADLSLPDAALRLSRPAFSKRGEIRLFRLRECLPILLYSAAASLTAYHAIIPDPAGLPEASRLDPTSIHDAGGAGDTGFVSDVTLHRLRVAAKNFRYILEAHQAVLGAASRQMIKEFKDFQDLLGNWHDAVTALAYLNRLSKAGAELQSQAGAWWKPWQDRRSEMRAGFLLKWPELTTAWFHQRISACLDHALITRRQADREQPGP